MGRVDFESLLDLSVEAVTRRVERVPEAPATVFVLTAKDIRQDGAAFGVNVSGRAG